MSARHTGKGWARAVGRADYYALLGVDRAATAHEIRAAYRALAKIAHPDGGGSDRSFRMLREAFETLADPLRRADYDRRIHPTASPPAPRSSESPRYTRRQRTPSTPDSTFTPSTPRLDPDAIPWWPEVTPTVDIRLCPAIGPGHGSVTLAVSCWVALIVCLPLALTYGWLLMAWLVLLSAVSLAIVRLGRQQWTAHRIDREFTTEFGSQTVFGSPGEEPHELAEQLTARLLARYLTRLPGVRIFHGLSWPDSVFADVDHAVLCGRRLVLIESKLWLPGHYTAEPTGALRRNGHPYRGGNSRLLEGVEAFRHVAPEAEIRGAIVIYPSRPGDITTGDTHDLTAAPMHPKQFIHEIGQWLATDAYTVDRTLFRRIVNRVVA